MKIFLALSAAVALSLCAFSQNETIEGNGKVAHREFKVSSFTKLKVNGPFEVSLNQSGSEKVDVEADSNLFQYFDVRNIGDELVIELKKDKGKNWRVKDKMKVMVSFKTLVGIELGTVGSVRGQGPMKFGDLSIENASVGDVNLHLTASRIHLSNASVGNITLRGQAQHAEVKHAGVGNVEAANFLVQSMVIENTGVGSAEVNAEKELKVKDSFLGKVRNSGKAPARRTNKVRV